MKKLLSCVEFILFVVFGLYAAISTSIPSHTVEVQEKNGHAVFTNNDLFGRPGCPLLPAQKFIFLVPPDADLNDLSLDIKGLKEEELDGDYDVKPALPPFSVDGPVWPDNRNIVNGKDINVYSNNAFYPETYIRKIDAGQLRCYKVVEVMVNLGKYNPVTKKMKRMIGGELTLTVNGTVPVTDAQFPIPAKFKKAVSRLVINYNAIGPIYNSLYHFTEKSNYVIFTESEIQSNSTKFQDFIQSKKDHGFQTVVLTESDWGGGTGNDVAESIREWLEANYQEMGIEYILFIGSSDPKSGKVPMWNNDDYKPTDFFYQDLSSDWDNKDGHAEVCSGRIPVYSNNIEVLDEILQRIIEYENAPIDAIQWRTHALLAAYPFDGQTPGSTLFEAVNDRFLKPQQWTCYRIYNDNNGNPDKSSCSESVVKEAWNSGNYGLVEWMTHGSATSASKIMRSSTASELASEGHPPIVIMGSCSNGHVENSGNLAFSVLKHAALGVVAATRRTLYNEGITDFDSIGYIQGILYECARGLVVDSLGGGDALDRVKSISKEKINSNIVGYNYFGCPAVGVYTNAETTTPIQNLPVASTEHTGFSITYTHCPAPAISVSYTIAQPALIKLQLMNSKGRTVQAAEPFYHHAGTHTVKLDASHLAKGVYFCTLQVGRRTCNMNKIMHIK